MSCDLFEVVENRAAQETLLKAWFVIFRCQKYVKKGYIEMEKWIYVELLKSVPGRSIFYYLNVFLEESKKKKKRKEKKAYNSRIMNVEHGTWVVKVLRLPFSTSILLFNSK